MKSLYKFSLIQRWSKLSVEPRHFIFILLDRKCSSVKDVSVDVTDNMRDYDDVKVQYYATGLRLSRWFVCGVDPARESLHRAYVLPTFQKVHAASISRFELNKASEFLLFSCTRIHRFWSMRPTGNGWKVVLCPEQYSSVIRNDPVKGHWCTNTP